MIQTKGHIMAATRLLTDAEVEKIPAVKAVFDDIRATRKSDFVNNFWRGLANDPALLKRTWEQVKVVMATESAIDPLTKEMIYIAVSTANGCSYCVHSHTAAARAKGMTDAQHGELVSIIGLAGQTNHLVTAMQIPVDPQFEMK
jgi:AhpD family alkylhydroperoxidase